MSTLIYGTEENTKSRASSTSGHQEYQEDQYQNIGATYISDVVFLFTELEFYTNLQLFLAYHASYWVKATVKSQKNVQ